MFKVRQNRAKDYIVNSVHKLSLKRPSGEIINIDLDKFLKENKTFQETSKGYKEEAKFKYQEVDIDPYFLGLWLGDGKSTSSIIYNNDNEVIDYLNKDIPKLFNNIKVETKYDRTVYKTTLSSIKPKYESFGKIHFRKHNTIMSLIIKNNLYNNKHIPLEYIVNSKDVRLKLLAGLIDSDGYKTSSNGYEISTKDENFANQIKYLCDSLSYRTSIFTKVENNKNYYRIHIFGNDLREIPVKISRKKFTDVQKRVDKTKTGIVVESLGIGDYYGFTLENEDKRFFLEDFTVTHNTAITAQMFQAGKRILQGRRAEFLFFTWEMSPDYLVDRHV
jgi:replicative DNA helicase